MQVSYAVIAEFGGERVPAEQQTVVTDLLRRDEVAQVVWAKKAEPQPRPARPRTVLVAMVLLDQTATDRDVHEVAGTLSGLGLVSEVRVEGPGPAQEPVAAIGVTSTPVPRRTGPAGE